MARTVKLWIGKTDDAKPSEACKRRIMERQDRCCALTGRPFTPKERPEFDHKVPLWLGGRNSEDNLHAIHKPEHAAKTKAEATVRAKVNNVASKHLGIKSPPARQLKGPSFPTPSKPPRVEKTKLSPRQLYEAAS